MTEPLLSIIIPIYNGENYVSDIVKNIISQNKDLINDIEIILVNDGSTDNSEKVCFNLAEGFSFVKYLKKTNGGIASARNLGLKHATGIYITFCDQDDKLISSYKTFLDQIIKEDADLLISNYSKLSNGIITEVKKIKEKEICERKKIETLAKYMLTYGAIPLENNLINPPVDYSSIWNCLIKTSFIKKHDLFFSRVIDYEDDWRFISQVFVHAQKVILTPNSYYCWKVNPKSESHTHKYIPNYFEKRISHLNWVEDRLKELGVNDLEISHYKKTPFIVKYGIISGFYNACSLELKDYLNEIRKIEYGVFPIIDLKEYKQHSNAIQLLFLFLLKKKKYKSAYLINRFILKKTYH